MAGITNKERERRRLEKEEKARRKPGRPTVRTPERKRIILEAVGLFLNREQCAGLAKMHKDTLNLWLREDPEFLHEFEEARCNAIRNTTACLARAVTDGSVPAMNMVLKAKGGDEWREQKTISMTTPEEERAAKDAFLVVDDEDDKPSE